MMLFLKIYSTLNKKHIHNVIPSFSSSFPLNHIAKLKPFFYWQRYSCILFFKILGKVQFLNYWLPKF